MRALIWQQSSNPKDPAGDGRGFFYVPFARRNSTIDGVRNMIRLANCSSGIGGWRAPANPVPVQ